MPAEQLKQYYYSHGFKDCQAKRYPLWATLIAAWEHVAAAAYMSGWKDAGGGNLRYFRDHKR